MMNKMFNYLKNARIDRINYLLRPERMRHKGCLYLIVKFFILVFAIAIGVQPLHVLQAIQNAAPENTYFFISLTFFVISFVLIITILLVSLNEVDRIWRRKEDEKYNGHEITLDHVLKEYLETKGLRTYNKQVVERLLKKYSNLNENIKEMSGKELALVEDAILYGYEIKDLMHPLAYGVKLIMFATIVVTCVTFVAIYEPVEDFLRARYRFNSGLGLLYVIFPIGIFCVWRAQLRAKGIWNALGPHGRNTARNILFYWPITLVFLFIISAYTT